MSQQIEEARRRARQKAQQTQQLPTSANTPEDEEEFLGFLDSFGRAIDTTQQLGYSFSRVIGEAMDWDELKAFGQRGVERQEEDIAEYEKEGRTVQDTELWKKFKNEEEDLEIGDLGIWLKQSAGDVVPPLAVTAGSMWAGTKGGAAIGAMIAGPAAPAGAAIGGTIGAIAGLVLPSYVLGVGEVDLAIKEKAGEDYEAPATALIGGVPIALLDVASLALQLKPVIGPAVRKFGAEQVVDELIKQGAKQNIAKAAVVSAVKNMPVEGVTEASQEYIADLVAEIETGVAKTDQEKIDMMINAGLKGAIGGAIGGGTFEAGATYSQNQKMEEQKALEEWRDKNVVEIDAELEAFRGELPENASDLYDLYGEEILATRSASREEMEQEIVALEREKLWGAALAREASKDALADVSKEMLTEEYLGAVNNLSDSEFADYIAEQFQVDARIVDGEVVWGDQNPETLQDISDNDLMFERWLDKHGLNSRDLQTIKEAMVIENVDSIMRLKGDTAVSKLGLFQFNQYVEDLMTHYTAQELRSIAIVADMFGDTDRAKDMTKTQLATHIAEEKASIELAKQKLGPYIDEKNQQAMIINMEREELGSVPVGEVEETSVIGTPQNRKLQRLIGTTGNAFEVIVQKVDPSKDEGAPGYLGETIVFKRYGPYEFVSEQETDSGYARNLPDRARQEFAQTAFDVYNELPEVKDGTLPRREMRGEEKEFIQQRRRRGAELSTLTPGYEGMTLDEFMATTPENEFKFNQARVVRGSLFHEKGMHGRGAFMEKFLSFLSTRFRPFGPMGLGAGLEYKRMRADIRALDKLAMQLAIGIDKALGEAVRTGEITSIDEGNRLLLSYLRKTGFYRNLDAEIKKFEELKNDKSKTKEQRAQYSKDLGALKGRKEELIADTLAVQEDLKTERDETRREALLERISQNTLELSTKQDRRVALAQLPSSLQDIALKSRKTIDSLSQRILDEMPAEILPEENSPLIQENLGRYLTSSFKLFEPSFGWNPRFSKSWNKEHQKLYERAIDYLTALNQQGGNTTWTKQDSINEIDSILRMEKFNSTTDLARIPVILTAVSADQAAGIPTKGGLLQERYKIPFAIRELMGEHTDPKIMVATTISRVSKLLEMAEFYRSLEQINEMPGEMHFSPVRTAEYSVPVRALGEWNPLDGYYTTPEFANEIEIGGSESGFFDNDFVSFYRSFILAPKAAVQFGKIVISPATQMRNFVGGGIMFLGNGHWRLGAFPVAMDAISKELFGSGVISFIKDKQGNNKFYDKGKLNDRGARAEKTFRKLQRLGIVNTSVKLNDVLGIFARANSGEYNTYNDFIMALYTLKNTKPGKVASAVPEHLLTTAKEFYAAADDFWKIAAWAAERMKLEAGLRKIEAYAEGSLSEQAKMEALMEFAERLTMKTGTGKVHNQSMAQVFRNETNLESLIDEIAAHNVRMGMPNYDYIGRFARTWRQIAFVGNFIAFPTEMSRVSWNIPQLAMQQATFRVSSDYMEKHNLKRENVLERTPLGQIIPLSKNIRPFTTSAFEKGLGFTIAAGGLGFSIKEIGKILFDIDEEDLDAARNLSADYAKDDLIIPIGEMRSPEEGGGFPALNGNYILPWSEISKLWPMVEKNIREAERTGDDSWDSGVIGGVVDWAANYSDQYLGYAISEKTRRAIATNTDPETLKPIYNEEDASLGEIAWDVITYMWKDLGPGLSPQAQTVRRAFAKGEKRFDDYNRTVSMPEAMAKASGLSPIQIEPTKSLDFVIGDTQKYFKKYVQPEMLQAAKGGEISEQDIIDQWKKAQSYWFLEQQRLYFEVQDMIKLNVDPAKIKAEFDDRVRGYGRDFYENIRMGIFTPWKIPKFYQEQFDELTKQMRIEMSKQGRDTSLITRKWPEEKLEFYYESLTKDKGVPASLLENPTLSFPWED